MENIAEAEDFLNSVREKYPDAGHHVFAWNIGGSSEQLYQRFSDDGEPHGTSGPPVLDVLVKGNIVDTIIVVTRYFGGTLLGTGGLVKAYGQSASGAIQVAGLSDMLPAYQYRVRIPYRFVDQITHRLELMQIEIVAKEFTAEVVFDLHVHVEKQDAFLELVQVICFGQAQVVKGDLTYLEQRRGQKDAGKGYEG